MVVCRWGRIDGARVKALSCVRRTFRALAAAVYFMKIFRNLDDREIRTPCIATFGVFDGLHLAHQQIVAHPVQARHASGPRGTDGIFAPPPRASLPPTTRPSL